MKRIKQHCPQRVGVQYLGRPENTGAIGIITRIAAAASTTPQGAQQLGCPSFLLHSALQGTDGAQALGSWPNPSCPPAVTLGTSPLSPGATIPNHSSHLQAKGGH